MDGDQAPESWWVDVGGGGGGFCGDGGGADYGGAGGVGGGVVAAGCAAGGEVSAEADAGGYADWGEAESGGGGDCGGGLRCGRCAAVRNAVMLEADLAGAVRRAFAGTLGEARMRLFHPLGFMLASPVESPEEAVERFAGEPDDEEQVETRATIEAFLEDKYDGMRAQVHCGDRGAGGAGGDLLAEQGGCDGELSGVGGGVCAGGVRREWGR